MEIINNINQLLGDNIKEILKKRNCQIKVAASCFSIYAYEALKEQLEKVDELQFLFTEPTFVEQGIKDKLKKERKEFFIPFGDEQNLYGTEFELRLKNELTQKAIARECADWIRRKVKFRSNITGSQMQKFMCVNGRDDKSAYFPMEEFSTVTLGYERGNSVSNYVTRIKEHENAAQFWTLFDQIWHDAAKVQDVTDQVIEHIASVYNENAPEQIYFLVLHNIFSEFLDDISEDNLPNELVGYKDSLIWQKLFNFQRDAATGIIHKLEQYSGCILADSVGLGKTFTALAVIKYYELRNKSVLVLCPKKLSDNWLNYNQNLVTNIFATDRFRYDVLNHTDLQRTSGYSNGIPLDKVNWGNYDLVVIDESHNFRNSDAFKERETRYQRLMNHVIKRGVKTKVLMLSATPVNNRFADLRNQLALAYEGIPEMLDQKLATQKSIPEIFRQAQAVFNIWSKLPPEERTTDTLLNSLDFDFFELLDSVTIARSRKHIERFYDTSEIGKFPERLRPLSFHCPLTMRNDVIGFNEIFERLMKLNMSIYAPFQYILPSRRAYYENLYDTDVRDGSGVFKQEQREESLKRLMTVNLLKRLESSVAAFRLSLSKLGYKHEDTISKINDYKAGGVELIDAEITDSEFDEESDEDFDSIGKKVQIKLKDMDIHRWRHDLEEDWFVVNELLEQMQKILPQDDSKLNQLRELMRGKLLNPLNSGNKKILVFSAFADTVDYLYSELHKTIHDKYHLHSAKIVGTGHNKSTFKRVGGYQQILTLFSPRSKEKALIMPDIDGEIDILFATDCISEGQNLQDCDYLINYDIHWNPVRIIQRFGRIDRIGSQNACVQLVNFWPDMDLDEYINLKSRVESRMVISDVTATGDENLLHPEKNELLFRKEQLKKLQTEVLDLEDLKSGVSITDLGLNDFRMDLLAYMKEHDNLDRMPRGLHAVAPANVELGLDPGVIYVLHNRNSAVNINQQNRLHPYYLVYVRQNGEVHVCHTEVKHTLDLFRAAAKNLHEPLPELYRPFNKETQDGRKMDKYSALLEECVKSIIQVKEAGDVDSLFAGGSTTALTDRIDGLKDFELVAFLVIRKEGNL